MVNSTEVNPTIEGKRAPLVVYQGVRTGRQGTVRNFFMASIWMLTTAMISRQVALNSFCKRCYTVIVCSLSLVHSVIISLWKLFTYDVNAEMKARAQVVREGVLAEITVLQKKNQESSQIFTQLFSFIDNDKSLKNQFNKDWDRSIKEGRLLPPYQKLEVPTKTFDDDVSVWGEKWQERLYWDGQITRVREFLRLNPTFAQLLKQKFFESDISNKAHALEHFGFS